MLKETVNTVGAAFALSPLGLPIVAHGVAGLIVGTAGLHLVNGVINDLKGAGDAFRHENSASQDDSDDSEDFPE
jgi:hypothetical protein